MNSVSIKELEQVLIDVKNSKKLTTMDVSFATMRINRHIQTMKDENISFIEMTMPEL